MSFFGSLLNAFRTLAVFVEKVVARLYLAAWRRIDRVRLANYDNDIRQIDSFRANRDGVFAIFVYYERDGVVSQSVRRILSELVAQDVQIVLVANHPLSDEQAAFFGECCHTVLVRGNQGFDFGCYKDAVQYLVRNEFQPRRLLILNDSVFYSSRGLTDFVSALLGPEDVIASYENWGQCYHFQSFALSIDAAVYQSAAFRGFWKSYVPSNCRRLAIEFGEMKLSQALLDAARSTRVVYSVSALSGILRETASSEDIESAEYFTIPWKHTVTDKLNAVNSRMMEFIESNAGAPSREPCGEGADAGGGAGHPQDQQLSRFHERKVSIVCDYLNQSSTVHSGAYFFARFQHSPLYKKDLVYRQQFRFWEIADWAGNMLPEAEYVDYLTLLRKKGDHRALGLLDLLKYRSGII